MSTVPPAARGRRGAPPEHVASGDVAPTSVALGSSAPETGDSFALSPALARRVGRVFAVVLLAVALGHVAAMLWSHRLGNLSVLNLVYETSVGTWVSAVVLLACAALASLAALLARRERSRWVFNWWLLAGAFALMSLDEVAAIHERFSTPVRRTLGTGDGLLYYAWVIPALLVVAVFVVVQIGFLRALDRATRRGLMLAGLVFVAGAVGLEMVEAGLESEGQQEGMLYLTLVLFEECMEIGAVMFVVCLLIAYLIRHHDGLRVVLPARPVR